MGKEKIGLISGRSNFLKQEKQKKFSKNYLPKHFEIRHLTKNIIPSLGMTKKELNEYGNKILDVLEE